MRGLVIWNTYAQPLVIKRLGIVDLCLADSNIFLHRPEHQIRCHRLKNQPAKCYVKLSFIAKNAFYLAMKYKFINFAAV